MNNNQNYGARANDYALQASEDARNGRIAKADQESLKDTFTFATNIMHDVWVGILSIFCLAVMAAEVIFSYDIYEDIAKRNADSAFLVIIIAGIVIFWGLVSSHLISAGISKTIQDLKVRRLVHQGEWDKTARSYIKEESKTHFIFGLVLGAGAIGFVFALSYIRIGSLQAIDLNGEFEYTYFDLLLPSLLVFLEIVSGIYLAYIVLRISSSRRIRKTTKAHEKYKQSCFLNTENAENCYNRAITGKDEFRISKELKDALYRYTHRSIANDDYLDSIEAIPEKFSQNGYSDLLSNDRNKSKKIHPAD